MPGAEKGKGSWREGKEREGRKEGKRKERDIYGEWKTITSHLVPQDVDT